MEWDGTRWVRLTGDTLQVRAGLVDRRDRNAQVLGVAEVFEYEPFMPDQKTDTVITPATNDIALIHLAAPADLADDWVGAIGMAEADADMSGKVTLTGWGARHGRQRTGSRRQVRGQGGALQGPASSDRRA